MLGIGVVLFFRPNLQEHLAAALRFDFVFAGHELTGYQSKEVARLFKGIFPAHPMTIVGLVPLGDQIAVGKQNGVERLVGVNRDGKATHHIGAIGPVGDVAKALSFALAHEGASAHVDARKRRVVHGNDAVDDGDGRLLGDIFDGELSLAHLIAFVCLLTVNEDLFDKKIVSAVKDKVMGGGTAQRRDDHGGGDRCGLGIQDKVELDRVNAVRVGTIVLAVNGGVFLRLHGDFPKANKKLAVTNTKRSTFGAETKSTHDCTAPAAGAKAKKNACARQRRAGAASRKCRPYELFVLVAGSAVASHAVGLGLIGKSLVHRRNHRLGRVDLHVADVMAAAAGDVINGNHPLLNGFSHFFTLFNLLFGRLSVPRISPHRELEPETALCQSRPTT